VISERLRINPTKNRRKFITNRILDLYTRVPRIQNFVLSNRNSLATLFHLVGTKNLSHYIPSDVRVMIQKGISVILTLYI
jgi:hypothetical protein